MDPNVKLRDEQVGRLAQYIANPRFLDLSDPGTGKTPPVCTYLWYVYDELGGTSLWTQPKSLLGKNRREILRWTPFKPEDVVILSRDWERFTGPTNWPTIERVSEEQLSDEVVIKSAGEAPCSKGDIVPTAVVEQWVEMGIKVKYDYNWVQEITDKQGLDVPRFIRSNVLKELNAELKKQGKKPLKAKRHYEKRRKVERVIDLIAKAKIEGAKVILCSFHFHREQWHRLQEQFENLKLLAVDELHMGYGGTDSATTSALYGTMKRKDMRFIGMTGTLLNGKLDSVFPAIHVIEPLYYPMGYSSFRQQHVAFEDDYGRVLSWKNEAKVGEILLRHGVRRTFQEVYGKEDVVFLPDLCDMNEQMRAEYDLFHEQAMLELSDGTFLDGSLPGVATIRARQIMAHPETFGLCGSEMSGKDERLEIHLADAIARGEHLLIFSAHTAEQERIVALLERHGRRVGLMNGKTSLAKRNKIDLAFQGINEDGKFVGRTIDDVVGSAPVMAVGYNWEHVDHVIGVSLEYGDVDWLQAYRRASRGTRTKTLRVSILQYADSIDQRVLEIVYQKSVLANKVDPTRPILRLAA